MSIRTSVSQSLYRGYELFPFLRPILRLGNRLNQRVFAATYRAGYPIDVAGHRLKVDADFAYHTRNIAHDDLLEATLGAIKPGDTVLDVGAWIGVFALCYGQAVGKMGKVYTFEPTSESFGLLKHNISLNGLDNTVFPFQSAVGDQAGNVTMSVSDLSTENKVLINQTAVEAAKTVPMTTIDAFCAEHYLSPNVIKIDIEGFELHALMGAQKTITECHPAIYVELHPHLWQEEDTREKITRLVNDLHYQMIPYGKRTFGERAVEFVLLKPADA